jgi:PadR family transcriptional regulator, regulatory protein PadR
MSLQEPSFLILSALTTRPLHGYGLVSEVQKLSAGRVRLSVGTLYGALDRLAEQGFVSVDREETVGGRLRRYYVLTDEGAEALAAEVNHLRANADLAASMLRKRAAQSAPRLAAS